jgi:hypothetical protein
MELLRAVGAAGGARINCAAADQLAANVTDVT